MELFNCVHPTLLHSIPQSDSLKHSLSLFSFSSTPIPLSLSNSFLISLLITIPSFYLNSTQTSTLSNSSSQSQETNTIAITNQFIPIPWWLFFSTDDMLLLICLASIHNSISDFSSTNCIDFPDPIPIYIFMKKDTNQSLVTFQTSSESLGTSFSTLSKTYWPSQPTLLDSNSQKSIPKNSKPSLIKQIQGFFLALQVTPYELLYDGL